MKHASDIIVRPLLTEKSTLARYSGSLYTFEVAMAASKSWSVQPNLATIQAIMREAGAKKTILVIYLRHPYVMDQASALLSGLAGGAGVVVTPARDAGVKHVEFVRLDPERALAVLVAVSLLAAVAAVVSAWSVSA